MALSAVSTLVLLPTLIAWAGPWLIPQAKRAAASPATSDSNVPLQEIPQ